VNHWLFVAAAYALTVVGTVGLAWSSYRDMRRAEAAAAALKDDR
jgi:Heme exporter protein D (CcmD)